MKWTHFDGPVSCPRLVESVSSVSLMALLQGQQFSITHCSTPYFLEGSGRGKQGGEREGGEEICQSK